MILSHYGAFLTMYKYIDVICMLIIYSFPKNYNLKKEIERIHVTCWEWNIGLAPEDFTCAVFTNAEIFRIPEKFTQWFLFSKISMS